MIEISFYRKYNTTWEKLQEEALRVIDDFEKEDQEILDEGGELDELVGELPFQQQYSDYRQVLKLGLKTFIFQVLNEWDEQDILFVGNTFYLKFQRVQIEGLLEGLDSGKLYQSHVELLKVFSEQKMKLSTDDFDLIMDNFEEEVVATMSSFDLRIIDINDDEDDEDGDDYY